MRRLPGRVIDADGAFEIAKETYVPDVVHNLTKVVLSGTNYVPSIFAPFGSWLYSDCHPDYLGWDPEAKLVVP